MNGLLTSQVFVGDGRSVDQVWLLRVGSDEPDPVGAFSGRGEVEAEFRLPGPGRFAAVDVSLEEDGGDPGHSGRSLAAGTFS